MSRRGNHEGSIFKRSSGKWRAQISLDGHRLSLTAATKAECQAWLRKLQDQIDQGLSYKGASLTLDEFLAYWLSTVHIALRPKVAHQYERIVANHISPTLGSTKLRELRPEQIDQLYQAELKLGIGNRTIRLTHAVLHRALKKANQMGYIARNPADSATPPRLICKEMMVLDEEQVVRFLIAARNSRNYALFLLAVKTGMRQGELLGLKWSDLNWTSGVLQVRRQLQRVPSHGFTFCEPKTLAGRRSIQLGEGTLAALRDHMAYQQQEKSLLAGRWQESGLIFTSSIGTPLDLRNLLRDFKEVLANAGLPPIRFHDLRHTAASIMLNRNIPVLTVSRILGHSKPSITLDVYGHLISGAQLEAARIMDEAFSFMPVDMTNQMRQTAFSNKKSDVNL